MKYMYFNLHDLEFTLIGLNGFTTSEKCPKKERRHLEVKTARQNKAKTFSIHRGRALVAMVFLFYESLKNILISM